MDYVESLWLLIVVLSFASNSILACIILFCQKLRNRSNAILCSMLISGCAISILYILPARAFPRLRTISILFCSIVPSIAYACIACYTLHLCGSCLDKVISIVAPFRHQHYFTARNTAIVIICLWITPYFICAIPLFTYMPYSSQRCVYRNMTSTASKQDRIFRTIFFTLMTIIPIGVTLTLYVVAFFKVNASHGQILHRSNSHKNWKIAKQMICVLGLFIICWIPYITYAIIISYRLGIFHEILFNIFNLAAFIYHIINPILISYFHGGIRLQMKHFCQRIRRKRAFRIHPNSNRQVKSIKLQIANGAPHQ